MMKDKGDGLVLGPAPREMTYHFASKINPDGDVSALCFDPPRAINLKRASWTMRENAVTCAKCRALLKAREK